MFKGKKVLILALVLVLMVPNITKATVEEITEKFVDLTEGDLVTVNFEHEVPEENMVLDGFKFVSFDNGVYTFEALRDMDEAEIYLYYEVDKGETEVEHEGGDGVDNGDVGSGEGTVIDWGAFDLGKHGWNNSQGYDRQYAIRIDAAAYQDYDEIYVIDTSENLTEPHELRVSKLEPDASGYVVNTGPADYELISSTEGEFVIKINIDKVEEGEELRYDIVYFMYKNSEDISNNYSVYTRSEYEDIISGGSGAGNTKPEPEEPIIEEEPIDKEEDPIIEEEPEDPIIEEEPNIEEDPIDKEDSPIIKEEEPIIEEEDPIVEEEDPIIEDKEQEEPIIEDEKPINKEDEDPIIEEEPEDPIIEEEEEPIVEEDPDNNVEEEKQIDLKQDVLPKTGEASDKTWILGLSLIVLAIFIRRQSR